MRSINDPMPGFYRVKATARDGSTRMIPLAYHPVGDFGDVECFVDGARVEGVRGIDKWPWAIPVTKEAYDVALTGRPWPDVDRIVHEAGSLSNNPPPDEELSPEEALRRRINDAIAGVYAYANVNDNRVETLIPGIQDKKVVSLIADDDASGRAQTLRSLLLLLSSEADKERVAEKDPHKLAAEEVDGRWQPIVKLAKAGADALRIAMSTWETFKFNKQQEEETERRRAEQAQVAAAQAEAVATGRPVAVTIAPPPPPAPAAPRKIKGGSGRAASVATVVVVQSVSDWTTLFQHLRLRESVQDALIKEANIELRAGNPVPGVVTQQIKDVK